MTRSTIFSLGEGVYTRRMEPELRAILEHLVAKVSVIDDLVAAVATLDRRMDMIAAHLVGIDGRLDGIDGRLDGIDGRLDGIDGRLDGIDGRLDRLEGRMDRLEVRMDSLRTEVREGFLSVADRFTTLEYRIRNLEDRIALIEAAIPVMLDPITPLIARLEAAMQGVREEMIRTRADLGNVNERLDGIADDMRQRFRGVTDRMMAIEKRLAA
ncbi:MAG: hypothetical protein ABIV28_06725 [Longimicrobiales bacterium]